MKIRGIGDVKTIGRMNENEEGEEDNAKETK